MKEIPRNMNWLYFKYLDSCGSIATLLHLRIRRQILALVCPTLPAVWWGRGSDERGVADSTASRTYDLSILETSILWKRHDDDPYGTGD